MVLLRFVVSKKTVHSAFDDNGESTLRGSNKNPFRKDFRKISGVVQIYENKKRSGSLK